MKPDFKPYYAVIFISKLIPPPLGEVRRGTSIKNEDDVGYAEMAIKMEQLAKQQPGFMGFERVRNEMGITLSYMQNIEAITNRK